MNQDELLRDKLATLRAELHGVNGNPLIPAAVKTAVGTTFEILKLLIEREVANGRAA